MRLSKVFTGIAALGAAGLVLGGCGAGSKGAAIDVSKPAASAQADASSDPSATPPIVGESPVGPKTDLVGSDPAVVVDHTGKYEWVSPVVLTKPPDQFNWSGTPVGDVKLSNVEDRLIEVPGGYSLKVTFTVDSFSGDASVRMRGVGSATLQASEGK